MQSQQPVNTKLSSDAPSIEGVADAMTRSEHLQLEVLAMLKGMDGESTGLIAATLESGGWAALSQAQVELMLSLLSQWRTGFSSVNGNVLLAQLMNGGGAVTVQTDTPTKAVSATSTSSVKRVSDNAGDTRIAGSSPSEPKDGYVSPGQQILQGLARGEMPSVNEPTQAVSGQGSLPVISGFQANVPVLNGLNSLMTPDLASTLTGSGQSSSLSTSASISGSSRVQVSQMAGMGNLGVGTELANASILTPYVIQQVTPDGGLHSKIQQLGATTAGVNPALRIGGDGPNIPVADAVSKPVASASLVVQSPPSAAGNVSVKAEYEFLTEGTGDSARTQIVFVVTRTNPLAPEEIPYQLSGLSAADLVSGNPLDFSGRVSFAPGQLVARVVVNIKRDANIEPTETLQLTLENGIHSKVTEGSGQATTEIHNDDFATYAIEAQRMAVLEGNIEDGNGEFTEVKFTITRTPPQGQEPSVPMLADNLPWSVAGLSPDDLDLHLADYSGTLAFAEGELSKVLTIRVRKDAIREFGNETLRVVLGDSEYGRPDSNPERSAASTIIIDDDPSIVISTAPQIEIEGDILSFKVTRTGATVTGQEVGEITIHYQLMAVATGSNSLPVSRTGTAVFPAGALETDIHVQSIDDSLVTSDQEFVVYITEAYLTSDPTQKIRVGTATANATIINNDAEVSIADLSVVSTNTPGVVTYELMLKREQALDFVHTVRWDVVGVGENPASLSDFTLPTDRTVVFNPHEETYTIRFTALAGQLSGGLRSFEVRLTETDPKVILGIDAARANISPDGVDVSIHAVSASSVEGNGTTEVPQTFEVTLSERPSATVVIDWSAASFRAADPDLNASGSDFLSGEYPVGQLTFTPDGPLTQTISITPSMDSVVESSERYKINLSVASGPAFVVIPTAVGTITNDDAQLGFSSLTYVADEGRDTSDAGHGVLNATIVREGFLRGYASVQWAVVLTEDENSAVDANFVGLTPLPWGVAEFTPGMSAKMISIDLAGNPVIDAAKHFKIVLSQPSPGISLKPGFDSAVATIANDDLVFSMHDAVLEAVETDAGTTKQVTITVDRTGDTQNAASVAWTLLPTSDINAADFKAGQSLTNTLSFAAGETSKSFVVEIKGDDDLESPEAFTLQLNNALTTAPRGTASIDPDKASTVVTILNDDNRVGFATVSPSVSGKENAAESNVGASTAFEYTLTREGDLSRSISVNWELVFAGHTASAGDFEAVTGVATFAVNASTATFNVIPKVTDVAVESNETFGIRLITPDVGSGISLNTNTLAQGTIEDDDVGIQIVSVASDGNSEGGLEALRTYTVTLQRVGNTALESHVSWSIAGEALTSGNTNVANALAAAEIEGSRTGEVSWLSGDVADKTFTFQVKGDADVEGDEALRIALTRGNSDHSDLQGDGHFVVIQDDDAVLEISSAVASVNEGRVGLETTLSYTISRTGDLSNTVGVDVYLNRHQTDGITRPTLVSNSAAPVTAGDDTVRADGATRYAHVQFNPSSSTVTITYTDGRPSQTISAVGGTQEANITVKLTGDDVQTLTGESITLSLDNVTTVAPGGRDTAVLINPDKQSVTTVIANDDAIFTVSGVATVNEGTSAGNTTAYDIVLTRAGSAGTATTIEWTVAGVGDDPINAADLQSFSYLDADGLIVSTVPVASVLPNGTLIWANDDPVTKTIRLNFKADALVELDESFKINLSSPTGNAEIHDQAEFKVIGDDVGVSLIAVHDTVIEGNPGDVRKLVFDVVRFGGVSSTYTVNWELTGLDASDVLGGVRSGQATIAANALRERIEITLASDSNWEAMRDKVATLTIRDLGAQELAQASVTVIDDDAQVSIAPLQAVAIEGSNAGGTQDFTFTVTRSLNDVVDLSQVSTVNWRVSPTSGISVEDFASGQNALGEGSGLPSGTLSFAEDQFSQTITIQIAQDSFKEDDETLTVELFNASSGTSIATANGTASGVIRNDDTLISFVAGATDESQYDLMKAEGDTGTDGTLYTFKLLRSGNTVGDATVNWTLVNITTTDGDFIGPRSGTVTFADGDTTAEFTVKVYGDTNATDYPSLYWPNTGTQIQSRLESDEQFKVVLSAPTDSQGIQASGESIATVQNDDVRIQLVRVTTNLPEGAVSDTTPYTQSVTLKRMGDASQAVSVEWFVPTAGFNSQIASASSDGITWVPATTSNSGTLTWAVGDVTDKTIYFRPLADDVKEVDYTFQVKLRPSSAADAGTAAIDEIGYVQNGNFVYAMPFGSTSWNTTSPAIATLTVKRDESGIWVSNEILETYNASTSMVTAIGQTYSGGDAANGASYFSNGINGVNYSGSLTSNVEGSFATAQDATDYTQIQPRTLTFDEASRTQTVAINIQNDQTAEFTEALSLYIEEGTRTSVSKDSATVAIEDNDTTPSYAVHTYGSKAIEGVDTHAQFKVTLGQPLTADATFALSLTAGTALLNSDYQSQLAYSTDGGQNWTTANTATLSAGLSSFLVRAPLLNDTRDEAVETLNLTVTKTSGIDVFAVPKSSAMSFIVDDDSPSIGTRIGADKIVDTALNQTFVVRTIDVNNSINVTPVTTFTGGLYTSSTLVNNAGAGQDFTVSIKLSGSWELAFISEEMGTTGQAYGEASNSVSLTTTDALHRSAPAFRALESLANGIAQEDGTTLYNIEVRAGTEQIVLRAPLTAEEAALAIGTLTGAQGDYAMTASVTHVNPLVVARDVVVSEDTGTATVEVIAVGGDFNSGAATVQVSTVDGTWVDKVFVFSREFSASGEQTATWHVASLTDAQLVDTPNESYVRGYFGQNRTGSVDASDFVILGDQIASGVTGLPTGTVTFKDGEKEAFVTIRVRADNAGELNEDFAIVLDAVGTGVEKLANPLAPKTYAALTPGYAGFAKIVNDDQVFSVKGMVINEATHSTHVVTANGLAVSSTGTALTSDQAATTATNNTLHRFVITRDGDTSAGAMVSWQIQVDAAADSLNRQADTADFVTTGAGAITWQSSAVGGVWSTVAQSVTFAAGESTKIVEFALDNDSTAEDAEQFRVVLSNPVGLDGNQGAPVVSSTAGTALFLIGDDDATQVSVSMAASVDEGNNAAARNAFTITFTRSTALANATQVFYELTGDNNLLTKLKNSSVDGITFNGPATSGAELVTGSDTNYGVWRGIATFAAGATTTTAEFKIAADTFIEPNTNVHVKLYDDAHLPESWGETSYGYGKTTGNVSVALGNGIGSEAALPDWDNTIRDPDAYQADMVIRDDDVRLWLGYFSNTLTWVDQWRRTPADTVGEVSVVEGNVGSIGPSFYFSRAGEQQSDITLNWRILDRASTDTTDMMSSADHGTVILLGSNSTETVTSRIITIPELFRGDTTIEGNESLRLEFSVASNPDIKFTYDYLNESSRVWANGVTNGTSRAGSSTLQANVTLNNDDLEYTLSHDTGASLAEGVSGAQSDYKFTVTRNGDYSPSLSPTTLAWRVVANGAHAVTGDDFATSSAYSLSSGLPQGTLSFNWNDTSKTITLKVKGDNQVEWGEGFAVEIYNPSVGWLGASSSLTGLIVNDDSGIRIGDATARELDGDQTGDYAFTVTRFGDLSQAATVDWLKTDQSTTSGRFVGDVGGTLSFDAGGAMTDGYGEQSTTITLHYSGDNTPGADTTFGVNLSNLSSNITASNNDIAAVGTVKNDDVVFSIVPVVNATYELTEGAAQTYSYTILRNFSTPQAQTVYWAVSGSGGSPVNASDFVGAALPSGSVVFNEGELSKTITVAASNQDGAVEDDEAFEVKIINLGGVGSGTENDTWDGVAASGKILNDDPAIYISTANLQFIEGSGSANPATNVVFDITRKGGTGDQTVTWTIDLGTGQGAAGTSDFATGTLTGSLTFSAANAAEETQTVTVALNHDTTREQDETFVIRLSNNVFIKPQSLQGIQAVIKDDDFELLPIASVVTDETDVSTNNIQFTVERSGGNAIESLISWRLVFANGAGQANADDFVATAGTAVMAAGSNTATIAVPMRGDTTLESDEAFTLEWQYTMSDGSVSEWLQTTGTLRNDDESFSLAVISPTTEGSGSSGTPVTITVTRDGSTAEASSVQWAVADNGSSSSHDFINALMPTGTVTFAPGDVQKTFTVNLSADSEFEPTETFVVTLSNPSANATLGTTVSQIGQILNDDNGYSITSLNTSAVLEGDAGEAVLQFKITRSGGATGVGGGVSWKLSAINSTDLSSADFLTGDGLNSNAGMPSGSVTFEPNEFEKTISVRVKGDVLAEALAATDQLSTARITLSSPIGGSVIAATAEAFIQDDDDVLTLTAIDTDLINDEGDEVGDDTTPGYRIVEFNVERTGSLIGQTQVEWAVAGTGVHPLSPDEFLGPVAGTLTFEDPGPTSKTIQVKVLADTVGEFDEQFVLTLTNPSTGTTVVTPSINYTIRNDDPVVDLAMVSTSVREGQLGSDQLVTFTVTRSGKTVGEALVDWVVSPNGSVSTDINDFGGFYPNGQVLFLDGESTKTVSFLTAGDNIAEFDEGFKIELSNAQNATIRVGSATGIITNDDLQITLTSNVNAVIEGNLGDEQSVGFRLDASGVAAAVKALVIWHVEGLTAGALSPSDFRLNQDALQTNNGLPSSETVISLVNGIGSQTVNVWLAGDNGVGPDEKFRFVVDSVQALDINDALLATGNVLGSGQAEITVKDDDTLIGLRNGVYQVVEGDDGNQMIRFYVDVLDRPDNVVAQDIRVQYSVIGIQGASADDFVNGVLPTGEVTISAAQAIGHNTSGAYIDIAVAGDTRTEFNEGFEIRLDRAYVVTDPVNNSGVEIASAGVRMTGSIIEDDQSLSLVTATPIQNEETGRFTIEVLRSGAIDNALDATWSLRVAPGTAVGSGASSNDFIDPNTNQPYALGASVGGSVSFVAGQSVARFTLEVNHDFVTENNEAFQLQLSSVNPSYHEAGVKLDLMILNDDTVDPLPVYADPLLPVSTI